HGPEPPLGGPDAPRRAPRGRQGPGGRPPAGGDPPVLRVPRIGVRRHPDPLVAAPARPVVLKALTGPGSPPVVLSSKSEQDGTARSFRQGRRSSIGPSASGQRGRRSRLRTLPTSLAGNGSVRSHQEVGTSK